MSVLKHWLNREFLLAVLKEVIHSAHPYFCNEVLAQQTHFPTLKKGALSALETDLHKNFKNLVYPESAIKF